MNHDIIERIRDRWKSSASCVAAEPCWLTI